METLETLKILNLAVQILKDIESLSIDDDVKEQLLKKVLESVGIEKIQTRKHTPGSQNKILESLQKFGGSATRADIASDSGLDPNVVSSLLNKLVKNKKVEKAKIDSTDSNSNRSGRGLYPEYMYRLVDERNGKVKAAEMERRTS